MVDEGSSAGRSEATLLKLSCDKALVDLGWTAVLSFEETVRLTGEWYRQYYENNKIDMFDVSRGQIREYWSMARDRGLVWSEG